MIGWVFFRVEYIKDAFVYLKRLFVFEKGTTSLLIDSEFYSYLFIAIFFAFITCMKFGLKWQNAVYFDNYTNKKHITVFILTLILLILSGSSIAALGFNPFIYFRF
jgi:hypothetical protein